MKYEYNSLFVTAPILEGRKMYKNYEHEINGVEFTRDVQTTILKMAKQGFELFHTITLTSTKYHQKVFTEGVTLIFRKEL